MKTFYFRSTERVDSSLQQFISLLLLCGCRSLDVALSPVLSTSKYQSVVVLVLATDCNHKYAIKKSHSYTWHTWLICTNNLLQLFHSDGSVGNLKHNSMAVQLDTSQQQICLFLLVLMLVVSLAPWFAVVASVNKNRQCKQELTSLETTTAISWLRPETYVI